MGSYNINGLKPIVTKRIHVENIESEANKDARFNWKIDDEESESEPLSPVAQLFHSRGFNCCILTMIGLMKNLNLNEIKNGLLRTLVNHPRFSSVMVIDDKGEMKWLPTKVDLDKHVFCPNLEYYNVESPEQFVEDYITELSQTTLDTSKPLWELHLLDIKTSDADAVGIFKIHHSIGDGMSLISLLLACTRKTSDPKSLPTTPLDNKITHKSSTKGLKESSWASINVHLFFVKMWSLFVMILNTFVDFVIFGATVWFLKDDETPVKGGPGVEFTPKRFISTTLSLTDIKFIKNTMNATINDVLLGATQAGLSRYLNRKYESKDETRNDKRSNWIKKLLESTRMRGAILFNIRGKASIETLAKMMENKSNQGWGNWVGYAIFPVKISLQDDPLDYVRSAKTTIDRKKRSFEAICSFAFIRLIVNLFGVKVAGLFTYRIFCNTTLAFSNVVGPNDEVSFFGHRLSYIAPTVYGHPHALTIHCQSYMDKMTITLAADKDCIPDPYQLKSDIKESLQLLMKAATINRQRSTGKKSE